MGSALVWVGLALAWAALIGGTVWLFHWARERGRRAEAPLVLGEEDAEAFESVLRKPQFATPALRELYTSANDWEAPGSCPKCQGKRRVRCSEGVVIACDKCCGSGMRR